MLTLLWLRAAATGCQEEGRQAGFWPQARHPDANGVPLVDGQSEVAQGKGSFRIFSPQMGPEPPRAPSKPRHSAQSPKLLLLPQEGSSGISPGGRHASTLPAHLFPRDFLTSLQRYVISMPLSSAQHLSFLHAAPKHTCGLNQLISCPSASNTALGDASQTPRHVAESRSTGLSQANQEDSFDGWAPPPACSFKSRGGDQPGENGSSPGLRRGQPVCTRDTAELRYLAILRGWIFSDVTDFKAFQEQALFLNSFLGDGHASSTEEVNIYRANLPSFMHHRQDQQATLNLWKQF